MAGQPIRISLIGPFLIQGPDGADLKPKLMKSRAILIMLALARDKLRSRRWLQDQLWSDRAHEQGMSSLRTCLSDIRRSLGPFKACLKVDYADVALDPDLVEIDFTPADGSSQGELVEGFDVPHADGFEDWLREERRAFEERRSENVTAPASGNLPRLVQPVSAMPKEPAKPSRTEPLRVALSYARVNCSDFSMLYCDSVLDCVGKTLDETGIVEITDLRLFPSNGQDIDDVTAPDVQIRADICESGSRNLFRISVFSLPKRQLIWSQTLENVDIGGDAASDPRVFVLVNQVAAMVIDHRLNGTVADLTNLPPAVLCQLGVRRLFRLGSQNILEADTLFERAYREEARGLYLAWRAYLRTFLLGERQYGCRATIVEEGLQFYAMALEAEPYNSMVLGLGAHVEIMLRRQYSVAHGLAERSVELNKCNPIGLATLGIAECYLGNAEAGAAKARLASRLAGPSRVRFQIDAWNGVAGLLAGDIDGAQNYAEMSHAIAPSFAPPLRLLAALYLHRGERERSHRMVEELKLREPDFSYERLFDTAYPSAGLRKAGLLDNLPKCEV